MTAAILLVACLVLAVAVSVLVGTLRRVEQRLRDLEQRGFVTGASAPSSTSEAAPSSTSEAAPSSTSEAAPSSTSDAAPSSTTGEAPSSTSEAEYVITRLGDEPDQEPAPGLETRLFADLVLRESVVKAASFAYGVRRGLSPANRNRIWFEMRREVKRARKHRRAEEREAVREWRARRRAAVQEDRREDSAA